MMKYSLYLVYSFNIKTCVWQRNSFVYLPSYFNKENGLIDWINAVLLLAFLHDDAKLSDWDKLSIFQFSSQSFCSALLWDAWKAQMLLTWFALWLCLASYTSIQRGGVFAGRQDENRFQYIISSSTLTASLWSGLPAGWYRSLHSCLKTPAGYASHKLLPPIT